MQLQEISHSPPHSGANSLSASRSNISHTPLKSLSRVPSFEDLPSVPIELAQVIVEQPVELQPPPLSHESTGIQIAYTEQKHQFDEKEKREEIPHEV